MAIKIYSDVTKRFYEDEAAAQEAEKALIEKRDAAAEERRQMAKNVEEKHKAFNKAREEYKDALNKFCEKYGAYHTTLNKQDLSNFFWELWNW